MLILLYISIEEVCQRWYLDSVWKVLILEPNYCLSHDVVILMCYAIFPLYTWSFIKTMFFTWCILLHCDWLVFNNNKNTAYWDKCKYYITNEVTTMNDHVSSLLVDLLYKLRTVKFFSSRWSYLLPSYKIDNKVSHLILCCSQFLLGTFHLFS